MDQELQDLLRTFDAIAENAHSHREMEERFDREQPGWRLAVFFNPTIRDDNVLLHIWSIDGPSDYFIHIHTNDDPTYTHISPSGKGITSSELWA